MVFTYVAPSNNGSPLPSTMGSVSEYPMNVLLKAVRAADSESAAAAAFTSEIAALVLLAAAL